MPQFRQGPDGPYPLTPKKLGAGGLAVSIVLGLALGVGGGAGSAASGAADLGASVEVSASTPLRTARTSRQKAERSRSRLKVRGHGDTDVRAEQQTDDCAAHADGQVRRYLLAHPCRSLQRATLDSGVGGARVVVSLAWIRMPDAEQAAELKELVDADGTGGFESLDPDVSLTGQHYDSSRDRDLVTLAEVEPLARSIPAQVLREVAEQAVS